MESKPTEMAALGRALCLGMLYDCRSDSFIPGITLWNKDSFKKDLYESWQPKTDLKFSASDSLSEKANFLDVSASLKASFLGGLVEVGGSAKYLRDSKSSKHQSRCTLLYSQTTKFEQLTMTQLGRITYPKVFEQKTATHVVTAVLYGARAFMVFDHIASTVEDQQKVEGNVNAVVKKIPSLSIEGQADLKMNDDEKNLAEEISVTFYGDFHLEKNPTTYKEALTVYATLPSLLNDKENFGVPVKVWLYPLVLLDQKAAALMREISTSLVSKTERIVEQFGEVERRCNDLVGSRTVQDFPVLKTRLQTFQDYYSDYKVVFQKALCRVLPDIRGGEKEEQALAEILDIHNKAPFTANKLNEWLESITTELQILSSYTKGLKDIRVLTSIGQLNAILFDPEIDVVVCLAFTSLTDKDKFLETLNEFLSSEDFKKLENVNAEEQNLSSQMPWFTSFDISQNMRENLSLFKSFSKANEDNDRIQFVIASIPEPRNPGTSIHLYEKGRLTDFKFKPVSKPPPPTLDGSESLKLQKSPTGETVSYRVEYRRIDAADAEAKTDQEEKWENRDTPDAQETFTLTGLQLGDQYWVRYRAVSKVGVSEASESIRFIPKATKDPSSDGFRDYIERCLGDSGCELLTQ
ncbi:stonustoxin subunit beta-like isoform X2 [Colossoma macropomum]|uniref:stonustoxin subunit beta-like isoform X2 n=1 Tax=Colossoma macropomum TaxID=42526 RepID=UPI00186533FC|nr:stonustoxin subunit beta-like isoform X2 [Colossoma macropomum]